MWFKCRESREFKSRCHILLDVSKIFIDIYKLIVARCNKNSVIINVWFKYVLNRIISGKNHPTGTRVVGWHGGWGFEKGLLNCDLIFAHSWFICCLLFWSFISMKFSIRMNKKYWICYTCKKTFLLIVFLRDVTVNEYLMSLFRLRSENCRHQ